MDAPARPHVRVGVDEPRDDGLAGHIDDPGIRWGRPAGTDADDPLVLDDDIGVLDDLGPAHGDHFGAAEHHRSLGNIPLGGDPNPLLGREILIADPDRGVRPGRTEAVVDRQAPGHVIGHEGVADRPVDGATIGAPRRELAADVGEFQSARGRAVDLGHRHRGHRTADLRNPHHIDVVPECGQGQVALRGHPDHVGAGTLDRRLPSAHEIGREEISHRRAGLGGERLPVFGTGAGKEA